MKRRIAYTLSVMIIGIASLAMTGIPEKGNTDQQAKYTTEQTRQVIEKMIEAHGGLKTWRSKPSISYRHTYVNPYDPTDPWTSDEIVEQGTRRVYQNWPLDKAEIIYDGKAYYGVNWQRGNPPKFTAHLAMYFANIPWLTQDEGVILGEVRTKKLADDPKTYIAIKMTFESGVGEASKDYYDLFIDPETHLLHAFEYIMTYGALLDLMELPAEMEFMGPFIKIIKGYETTEGLTVPNKIITTGMEGEDYGYHIYKNWSFSRPFKEEFVKIPAHSIKDTSSNQRKMK